MNLAPGPRPRHLRRARGLGLRGGRRGRALARALPLERPRRRLGRRRPDHPGRTVARSGARSSCRPRLLPSLVRYLNHHPSLSYAFAPECVGSAGQGPRPDEGVRERFDELGVALDRLAQRDAPRAGGALDVARAAPRRRVGQLPPGRAQRREALEPAPARARARWAWSSCARCACRPPRSGCWRWAPSSAPWPRAWRAPPTRSRSLDWGPELHDRASLPHWLGQDLRRRDRRPGRRTGSRPGRSSSPALAPEAPGARPGRARPAPRSSVRRAADFWPLLGDVASQEGSTARLVDASSERLELLRRPRPGTGPGRLAAQGVRGGAGGRRRAAPRGRASATAPSRPQPGPPPRPRPPRPAGRSSGSGAARPIARRAARLEAGRRRLRRRSPPTPPRPAPPPAERVVVRPGRFRNPLRAPVGAPHPRPPPPARRRCPPERRRSPHGPRHAAPRRLPRPPRHLGRAVHRRVARPRPAFRRAIDALDAHTRAGFAVCQGLAERALLNQGVTFSVYSDQRGTEKIFPFCLVPRMVSAPDWARLERGLVQRVRALELFLDDVYGDAAHPRATARSRPSWCWRRRAGSRSSAGVRPAGRRAHPHRRHRPDPRSRGHLPRARGQPAHARRASPTCSRTASSPSGSSPTSSTRRASSRSTHYPARLADVAALGLAGGPGRDLGGGAHPGPVQLGLLRAQLPGPHHGARAGAGRPTSSSSGDRVFCRTTRGPRRGPRHLPAHRRDLPRPGGLPPRQPARRARASCAPGRRAT